MGAHDGFVFQKQASEIKNEPRLFCSVILSLSSHAPFAVPMETKFPGDDIPSKFRNSCTYTDQSIGEYFARINNEPWYSNTSLSQLQISHEEFSYINNLLNPSRSNFAYYTSDDACGWVTNQGAMLYNFKRIL